MSKKIGRTAWAVYCCLASHCHNKDWCTPTIPKIREWLDNQVNQKTIEKALKELIDKGLIVRNCPISKRRWRLVHRMSNSSVPTKKTNTLKVRGGTKVQPSKLEPKNPSKLEPKNPSKLDPIKENRKEKIKYSLSELKEMTWTQRGKVIVSDYEEYSEITGHIVSEQKRITVKQVLNNKWIDDDDREETITRILRQNNPFSNIK
tara:strand:- start:326 stop:937 length:612 start_codon:yes stop_codon:yes gene_type:complete